MLTKTIRRSILDIRPSASILPPTFLLPLRSRSFNSTAQIIDSPTDSISISSEAPPSNKQVAASPSIISPPRTSTILSTTKPYTAPPPSRPPPTAPQTLPDAKPISSSTRELLPMLLAQSAHFTTVHIHGKPYLLTTGDTVRLPFKMPGVVPGDVLRLNRATAIGSRDYTLKGSPYIDERAFELRATVLGTEGEPVRVKEKTKRRNRRVKTVRSKHKFTVLRVGELRIKTLEEIDAGEV